MDYLHIIDFPIDSVCFHQIGNDPLVGISFDKQFLRVNCHSCLPDLDTTISRRNDFVVTKCNGPLPLCINSLNGHA